MQPKYSTRRARVHVEKYGTGVLRDLNTIDSFTISINEEVITKKSTNEVKGTVARATVDVSAEGSMTMGSTEWANFVLVTRAKESVQAAAANATFTFPAGNVGHSFKLPHGNITAITVPDLTENVDYQVFKSSGIVTLLKEVTAAKEGGQYSSGLAKRGAIAAAAEEYYTLHVTDELNGEYTCWHKAQFKLPQNLQAISPDQFGNYEVSITLLTDETKATNSDFGQIGYKLESVAAA